MGQQQPQQQHSQQQQPQVWAPNKHTIFLLLDGAGNDFEIRARQQLRRDYGEVIVQKAVNANRLSDRNTIVCVYCDPDADVVDTDDKNRPRIGDNGKPVMRARFLGRRGNGPNDRGIPPDKVDVKRGTPVKCADYWIDNGGDSSMLMVTNLDDRDGLIAALTRTCAPAVVKHRPDNGMITMWMT